MTNTLPQQTDPSASDSVSTSNPSQPRRRRRWAVLATLGLLLLAGGAYFGLTGLDSLSATESSVQHSYATAPVVGTPFRAVVQTKGTIDSARNTTLSSEVRGYTTILSLLPQGTKVAPPVRSRVSGRVKSVELPETGTAIVTVTDNKTGKSIAHRVELANSWSEVVVAAGDRIIGGQILAGDIVCELDSSKLLEDEKQEQIYVTNTKANFEMAKKNLDIRATQNESNLSAARLRAELAALDLQKYLDGTFPQQQEKLAGQIQQNQETLARANESYSYIQRLQLKGYKSHDDVETARLKVLQAKLNLSNSATSLDLLETHTHDRSLLQLRENAEDSKRDLKRVELQCDALMAQLKSIALSRERVYGIYLARLQRIRDQIRACRMIAPHAGQVVHAQVQSRNSSVAVVEEGLEVRERQDIVHLPDLSSMKVAVDIHESVIRRVHEGQQAEIWVDALPGVTYRGRLTSVSAVPLPGRFPNVERKVFAGEVVIDAVEVTELRLRPGMTARVELITARSFDDLPQIPQSAVVSTGGRNFTWVVGDHGAERRAVELGLSNDATFVVEGGLSLGEQVVLNPRDFFAEEIDNLDSVPGEPVFPAAIEQPVVVLTNDPVVQSPKMTEIAAATTDGGCTTPSE